MQRKTLIHLPVFNIIFNEFILKGKKMIRKILGLILSIGIIYFVWSMFTQDNSPVLSDIPTEQEQRAIEENQPEPESVPESDMENQSPENAEQDS